MLHNKAPANFNKHAESNPRWGCPWLVALAVKVLVQEVMSEEAAEPKQPTHASHKV